MSQYDVTHRELFFYESFSCVLRNVVADLERWRKGNYWRHFTLSLDCERSEGPSYRASLWTVCSSKPVGVKSEEEVV